MVSRYISYHNVWNLSYPMARDNSVKLPISDCSRITAHSSDIEWALKQSKERDTDCASTVTPLIIALWIHESGLTLPKAEEDDFEY